MRDDISLAIVASLCGVVLLIAFMKQRAQLLLAFLVRMIVGAAAIYFINGFLAEQGIPVAVGLNPISLLTTGILGSSGLALLYAILACDFL